MILPRRATPGHYLLTVYVGSLPKLRKVVHISGRRASQRARLLGATAAAEAVSVCTARFAVPAAHVDGPDGASAASGTPSPPAAEPLVPEPVPAASSPQAKVLSFVDSATGNAHPAVAIILGIVLLLMLATGIAGMTAFVRGRTRSA